MQSVELSGWIEYLHLDDDLQMTRMARAITMAFRVERKPVDDGGEEVIDTTQPEFAKHFKGFINEPKGKPAKAFHQRNTDIRMG